MPTSINDIDLKPQRIVALENAQELQAFFNDLQYDASDPISLPHAALGMDKDNLAQDIMHIRRLAVDPVDGDIEVYLFEMRRVNMTNMQATINKFRERNGRYILIFTKNYDELEFVLLDRIMAESKNAIKGAQPRYTLYPRFFSVNRKAQPETTELLFAARILKRFTFTEVDGLAQWEKLRSAYTLAEWSEPNFNNRALFSDYYLNERLTDEERTPEWKEDVRPVGRKVRELIADARQKFSNQAEAVTRAQLIEPLFRELGFHFEVVKAADSAEKLPDYNLYAPDDTTKPIALALTYVWNRNLDDTDIQRDTQTRDEIPGALVVSLLEQNLAPWVIVTNGKTWRLYSATASNKATNYYEVDLEEALASNEQIRAFKYWLLMFRSQAFTGFLDDVLAKSSEYAKDIRDRLKDRVFVEIFPQFAKGFIANIRAEGVKESDIDLGTVFTGTMTFLYRLMFILYAESLELLPIKEERGYGEHSLRHLKTEIASAAANIDDQAASNLRAKFNTKSTALYQRLATLFAAIDAGNSDLNLPAYNGGLFNPTSPTGEFLTTYAIPDAFLAVGLDRLARDIDSKTGALVPIDFKSLGVRQLGSIYEGLLEFKLHIAAEKLAVTKEKGKEVYQPAAKVKGRVTATLDKGEVYLENDKRERKATGSYYTPDYIVKYIVEHTVGPVLDRKFSDLRPRLHDAQRRYRQHKATTDTKNQRNPSIYEDPEKFWNNDDLRHLADDCLDIRVLDPAMGSGHFLVEVVDYVSNRLIDFLNGFSENPVWTLLERTRRDIREDLDRQRVTLDTDKLTRVALLKRAVLKRCVYGVDLNPMAVELAKVSLWLDAFTLGAPLSFLDHHLKHGNSLIGARVNEVQEALKGQATLFASSQFAGVMLATDLMRQISYRSDNTVAQAKESADAYRSASDHLAPYKRLLDVYTSRWFSNQPVKKEKIDRVLEFLLTDDTEKWLKNPNTPLNPRKYDYIKGQAIAANSLADAADKHFFHWELEFPEVFFAPSKPGGQDISLREDGGFDAVGGNPPYDELSEDALGRVIDEKLFLENSEVYREAISYRINLYRLFIANAVDKTRAGGNQGFIVPMSLLADRFSYELRRKLLNSVRFTNIEAFPQKDDPRNRVFFDAKLSTCIYILAKEPPNETFVVRTHPGKEILENSPSYLGSSTEINQFDPFNCAIPVVGQEAWQLLKKLTSTETISKIGEYATPMIGEVVFNQIYRPYLSDDPQYTLVLRGGHVQRYEIIDDPKQGEPVYIDKERWLKKSSSDSNAFHHLKARIVYQEASPIDNWRRIIAAYLPPDLICGHTISYFIDIKCDTMAVLAIFNSSMPEWFFNLISATNHISSYQVAAIPFPRIDFTTPLSQREESVQIALTAYHNNNSVALLKEVQEVGGSNQTDVVHDVLAFLAQQMLDLNQSKQAEVKRFLAWLETTLKIKPDSDGDKSISSLTQKTRLQNYLGDYQKGEKEITFDDYHDALYQNRKRFNVLLDDVKAAIETAYAASLQTLLPIKDQLARTDLLIDQIVYKLYGLTDEEIALIERPQVEQAVADAKAAVLADDTLKDDPEAALEYIAEAIEPALTRLNTLSPSQAAQAALDTALPAWRDLSDRVRTFLSEAERDLLDDTRADYSGSVVNYAKAVEVTLNEKLFLPFRDAGYTAADVLNDRAFKPFMSGGKSIMLGSVDFCLASAEKVFRGFILILYPDANTRIFDKNGLRALLSQDQVARRNGAAHEAIMTHQDALDARDWALAILSFL